MPGMKLTCAGGTSVPQKNNCSVRVHAGPDTGSYPNLVIPRLSPVAEACYAEIWKQRGPIIDVWTLFEHPVCVVRDLDGGVVVAPGRTGFNTSTGPYSP